MPEKKRDKGESVLTDKEKFVEDPDQEKVKHMGDKPRQAQDREKSPKSRKK